MKKALVLGLLSLAVMAVSLMADRGILGPGTHTKVEGSPVRRLDGIVLQGETLSDIFKRNGLDGRELFSLTEACRDVYELRRLVPGQHYTLYLDDKNRVQSFSYLINDDSFLSAERAGNGFDAKRTDIVYETRIGRISGVIKDNLVSSMNDLGLALALSDIFAWDIDFTVDLRDGDTFKVVVEELWHDGKFRKYGRILSSEFGNNGQMHYAYRFEHNGDADYYDDKGRSLRREFLKAPLSYRRISSGFSKGRFHPILRIYRPHLGVDYAAPQGTPVSSVGDGAVEFAGCKGQNGIMVRIRHRGSYITYYGHLSGLAKGIRAGARVRQGQVIGYVGSTGLSTGPHLDYRIKLNGRFINPMRLKMPREKAVPTSLIAEFKAVKTRMAELLTSIGPSAEGRTKD